MLTEPPKIIKVWALLYGTNQCHITELAFLKSYSDKEILITNCGRQDGAEERIYSYPNLGILIVLKSYFEGPNHERS